MEKRKLSTRLLMILWSLLILVGFSAGPFLAAGTLRWPACWVYFGACVLGWSAHHVYVKRTNPALLERRKRIGPGTKSWDLVWNLLFWPFMITIPLVAGLGVRLGWAIMPWSLWFVGVFVFGLGLAISGWAMSRNPHFEGTIRIQHEIGHRVIDAGPYRFIRHPGYVGLCLVAIGTAFLTLSWPSLIPACWVVVWVALRTALEDATLRRELEGYQDYCRRTRFRLVPGLW